MQRHATPLVERAKPYPAGAPSTAARAQTSFTAPSSLSTTPLAALFVSQVFADSDYAFVTIVDHSLHLYHAAVKAASNNNSDRNLWHCPYAKHDGEPYCSFSVRLTPNEAGEWVIRTL
jgi:hypothetical protein